MPSSPLSGPIWAMNLRAETMDANPATVEPHELLQIATADFLAGKYSSARSAYESLRASGFCGAWPAFFLGRLSNNEGNVEAAALYFDEALTIDPDLFWANYEKLILAYEANRAIGDL